MQRAEADRFKDRLWRRNIYKVTKGDTPKYVYLLGAALRMENTALISANLAEQLVSGITEMSYRECAKKDIAHDWPEHQCHGCAECDLGTGRKNL